MDLRLSETHPPGTTSLHAPTIQTAIEGDQLRLHYQPVVSLGTGDITGFEALLRWLHPERGVLHPSAFMPSLDEQGSLPEVTRWAVGQLCEQARSLKNGAFPAIPTLSMNVAAAFLRTEANAREFLRMVLDAGVRPEHIGLEISHKEPATHLSDLSRSLELLAKAGVLLYLDNFGTASFSVAALADLPVSGIKIDRSCVARLNDGRNGDAVLATLIGIVRTLNKRVIAVGVEDARQVEFLKNAGCDLAQGEYFAAALEVQAALWLRRVGKPGREGAQIDSTRLRAFDIFRDLPDEQVESIAKRCGERDFAPGALVIRQGEVGNEIYLLEDGAIEVSRDSQRSVKRLVELRAPTVFGEMAIVNPERIRTANVRALTEVRVVSVPVDALLSFCRSWPAIKDKLKQMIAARLSA